MRRVLLTLICFVLAVDSAFAQSGSEGCPLPERTEFADLGGGKELAGRYLIIFVPTWSDEAEPHEATLHLRWESRLEPIHAEVNFRSHPLIGHMEGDCGSVMHTCIPRGTGTEYDEGREPNIRFDPDHSRFMSPGGTPGYLTLDGPSMYIEIYEMLVDGFRGRWRSSTAPLGIEMNGEIIVESNGYYCATRIE